jgi:hypothetical protein
MTRQGGHEFLCNGRNRLPHAGSVVPCKMVNQQRDIFTAIPQRRQFNGKHAEPIEEVGAKLTFVDHFHEIPVCSADHPHIGVNRGRTAETLKLPFLHDAQELRLQFQGKVSNFVQKQRPPVSPLEPSDAAPDSSGVGATLVTEQLAFPASQQELRRNSPSQTDRWIGRSTCEWLPQSVLCPFRFPR